MSRLKENRDDLIPTRKKIKPAEISYLLIVFMICPSTTLYISNNVKDETNISLTKASTKQVVENVWANFDSI